MPELRYRMSPGAQSARRPVLHLPQSLSTLVPFYGSERALFTYFLELGDRALPSPVHCHTTILKPVWHGTVSQEKS